MHAESAQKRRGSESAPLCDVTMYNKHSRNSRMRNQSVSLTGTEEKLKALRYQMIACASSKVTYKTFSGYVTSCGMRIFQEQARNLI